MRSTVDGGLTEALPSPCRSLVFRLDGSDRDLGVLIVTETGLPLAAGGSYQVRLTFWAGGAIHRGSRFTLRYPVRAVGHGEVL